MGFSGYIGSKGESFQDYYMPQYGISKAKEEEKIDSFKELAWIEYQKKYIADILNCEKSNRRCPENGVSCDYCRAQAIINAGFSKNRYAKRTDGKCSECAYYDLKRQTCIKSYPCNK
jgi:hypothetical protein